jgi:alpha-ketoglutaric semialdehyde dehydrogenase
VKHKNFIAGKWMAPSTKKYFSSIDPHTEKSIGEFPKSSKLDMQQAIKAAQKALPSWKNTPAPKRGEILMHFATLLRINKERLAKLMTQEMGKVLNEARGDVQEAIDVAEYMAGEGRRLFGHTTPSELSNKWCMTTRVPLGVVGVITPWNFPVAIPCWKIMPALICGNTVVFKPSSDSPYCALEVVKLLHKAGVPPGVVNLVTGSGKELGDIILQSPIVQGISFTGGRETGKYITANAGLKKVGLELGGKNAIIVMDDANLDLAVEGVVWGAFGTTGQRCTATSRVIVHKKVSKEFERRLLLKVNKLKLGSGLKRNTDVGPLVNKKAVEKSESYILIGKQEGARLLRGGHHVKGRGHYFEPTIFTNVKRNMRIAKEEIFGPVLSIIPVKDLKEAVTVANAVDYGLSSAIYTKDLQNSFLAIQHLDAGITYVNSSTIGAEVHLPFGGTKDTGNGTREAGWTGLDEMSEIKTVYIDYSGKLQKAQNIE